MQHLLDGLLSGSVGTGEAGRLSEVTDDHVDAIFDLNTRGSLLFAAQKALLLFGDDGSILIAGSIASIKGVARLERLCRQQCRAARQRPRLARQDKDRRIRVNLLSPAQIATPIQQLFDDVTKQAFRSVLPRGKVGHPDETATAALCLTWDDSRYVDSMEPAADGGTSAI